MMTRSFNCLNPRFVGALGYKFDFAGRHQQAALKSERMPENTELVVVVVLGWAF